MAESGKPTDLVITYTAGAGGPIKNSGHERLEEALQKGYRVVDIISTPPQTGDGSFVVITVLLTAGGEATRHPYKRTQQE